MSRIQQIAMTVAIVSTCFGSSTSATTIFQGRLANGSVGSTCTVSGQSKCAMFYDSTLNITILNNWSIGQGAWSATAAVGSAQFLAAAAGFSATGLTGWVLPTGEGNIPGASSQFSSIWNDVGGSSVGLKSQFDGVLGGRFWSSTDDATYNYLAWYFSSDNGSLKNDSPKSNSYYVVAVRPGDVAAIPEPETYAMLMAGLSVLVMAVRQRSV